ncbi:hypothetical protein IEQ34_008459 [Dendrobium chrysotoxum]|uniref:Uncharacterized protein n=1 Tax=Dendrobium chrysotoxum TaxID=161865 RepID=A0AAV7GYN9_DENCH|nr:hypothetical protein IEQ34_008459 [Dendrobium chrysotoxum]
MEMKKRRAKGARARKPRYNVQNQSPIKVVTSYTTYLYKKIAKRTFLLPSRVKLVLERGFGEMTVKKVDVLDEKLEQIKYRIEERL